MRNSIQTFDVSGVEHFVCGAVPAVLDARDVEMSSTSITHSPWNCVGRREVYREEMIDIFRSAVESLGRPIPVVVGFVLPHSYLYLILSGFAPGTFQSVFVTLFVGAVPIVLAMWRSSRRRFSMPVSAAIAVTLGGLASLISYWIGGWWYLTFFYSA